MRLTDEDAKDRTLDALVGERLMGHEWRTFGPAGNRAFILLPPENLESSWAQVCTTPGKEAGATLAADWARWLSCYATDWTAMKSVVETMRERWRAEGRVCRWEFGETECGDWNAIVREREGFSDRAVVVANATDLPEAVATAALLASGLTEAEIDGEPE